MRLFRDVLWPSSVRSHPGRAEDAAGQSSTAPPPAAATEAAQSTGPGHRPKAGCPLSGLHVHSPEAGGRQPLPQPPPPLPSSRLMVLPLGPSADRRRGRHSHPPAFAGLRSTPGRPRHRGGSVHRAQPRGQSRMSAIRAARPPSGGRGEAAYLLSAARVSGEQSSLPTAQPGTLLNAAILAVEADVSAHLLISLPRYPEPGACPKGSGNLSGASDGHLWAGSHRLLLADDGGVQSTLRVRPPS
ncbi:hypothetical protein NDU88_004400 [Pleurodeles waltl]|uniref:Uncharacterized protein n=1 Tax=Pleurodeles waltl TaxID=8319 RepID=A0AAV7MDY0_PLEWA|nr:hypothetical protein NDU88_004400 [Pleurodeles waltl]